LKSLKILTTESSDRAQNIVAAMGPLDWDIHVAAPALPSLWRAVIAQRDRRASQRILKAMAARRRTVVKMKRCIRRIRLYI
jgi:hypothetical protein